MQSKITLAILAFFLAAPAFADGGGATAARGMYFGLLVGGGTHSGGDVTQRGTAYFVEANGGPLAVDATGKTDSSNVGLFGAQIGHEWSRGRMLAAVELEGLYLPGRTQHAKLQNNASPGRLDEQTFDDSFNTKSAVLLGNLVFSFPMQDSGLTPYVGAGFGLARVGVTGANSAQVNPTEPGINHFNSGTDSSAWTFATQVKAGARYALGDNAYLFGELRYLYVDAVEQNFGSTVYPTHAATSDWKVRFDGASYYLATIGIGLSF
ncbi:MAG TPA: outer membrane beta-barrel protein [Burkholderiales bacterium]|nr:outer membrane beta-barrel protein [Burkholderiales bacterium]